MAKNTFFVKSSKNKIDQEILSGHIRGRAKILLEKISSKIWLARYFFIGFDSRVGNIFSKCFLLKLLKLFLVPLVITDFK